MLTERETTLLKMLEVHDGIVNIRSLNNSMPHRTMYRLYEFGYITYIRVLYNGRTEISEKKNWWNRKKGTVEFVKRLRERTVAVHRENAAGWHNTYIALTPLGRRVLKSL